MESLLAVTNIQLDDQKEAYVKLENENVSINVRSILYIIYIYIYAYTLSNQNFRLVFKGKF